MAKVVVTEAAIAAYEELRASDGRDWIVLTAATGGSTISMDLKKKGKDGHEGLERALELMRNDVSFGACAFWAGDIRRPFFYSYVGEGVSGMKRGQASALKGAVFKALHSTVGDIQSSSPDEFTRERVLQKLKKDAFMLCSDLSRIQLEPPAGWAAHVFESSSRKLVAAAAPAPAAAAPAPAAAATAPAAAGGSGAAADPAPSYTEKMTGEGYKYYVNNATGESVWEQPVGATIIREALPEGWTECKTDDGHTYFLNADGTSTWVRPT